MAASLLNQNNAKLQIHNDFHSKAVGRKEKKKADTYSYEYYTQLFAQLLLLILKYSTQIYSKTTFSNPHCYSLLIWSMAFKNGGEIAGIRRIWALEQKDELQAWGNGYSGAIRYGGNQTLESRNSGIRLPRDNAAPEKWEPPPIFSTSRQGIFLFLFS